MRGQCADSNCNHQTAINEYYNNLINVLNDAATESIPIISGTSIKPYWSEHLQQLKDESIQIHNTWVDCGKPRNGPINRLRLNAKYKYKTAIKQAALSFEWDLDDELSELYLRKDMSRFWKNWQSRFSKRSLIPQHVNNSTDAHEIAEKFCMHFAASSFDSYSDDSGFTEISSKLEGVQPPYNDFSVSDIEQALNQLKHGKAPGLDGIVKEHITLSHPAIIMHLTFLFNMMSAHCYVPDSFGISIIIPYLKNQLGDITDIKRHNLESIHFKVV